MHVRILSSVVTATPRAGTAHHCERDDTRNAAVIGDLNAQYVLRIDHTTRARS
jgi:hypothetical protein